MKGNPLKKLALLSILFIVASCGMPEERQVQLQTYTPVQSETLALPVILTSELKVTSTKQPSSPTVTSSVIPTPKVSLPTSPTTVTTPTSQRCDEEPCGTTHSDAMGFRTPAGTCVNTDYDSGTRYGLTPDPTCPVVE